MDARLGGAALLSAALLTTPYSLDYDRVLMGPALALLVAHGMARGFLPWKKTVLAAAWASPRLVMAQTGVKLGLAAPAGVFALAAGRAVRCVPRGAGLGALLPAG